MGLRVTLYLAKLICHLLVRLSTFINQEDRLVTVLPSLCGTYLLLMLRGLVMMSSMCHLDCGEA